VPATLTTVERAINNWKGLAVVKTGAPGCARRMFFKTKMKSILSFEP
jgi:hypothetical protein